MISNDRKPRNFKVSWFEVPSTITTIGPAQECWEEFRTRREAKRLFRALIVKMDKHLSYRGRGEVASVFFTECY